MTGLFLRVACALSLAGGVPAAAQDAVVLELYERVNRTHAAPSDAEVSAALEAMWTRLKTQDPATCIPGEISRTPPQPATADRMIFNAVVQDQAMNGWTTIVTSSGCPVTRQRFVLARMKDGTLNAIPANPGDSLTTSSQFRDTMRQAMMAMKNLPDMRTPACRDARIDRVETRVTSRAADLGPDVFGARYAGSWQEEWTLFSCGKQAIVPIGFRADGTGGVFAQIAGDKVRLVKP
jgi:hypothetical protein